jgi:hypothetical protein
MVEIIFHLAIPTLLCLALILSNFGRTILYLWNNFILQPSFDSNLDRYIAPHYPLDCNQLYGLHSVLIPKLRYQQRTRNRLSETFQYH